MSVISRTCLAAAILVLAILCGGCASAVAIADAQDARDRVDQVNLANWAKVRQSQLAFLDGELDKLDASAGAKIAVAGDGPGAASIFAAYLRTRQQLTDRRAQADRQYSAALDNAQLSVELGQRQRAIIDAWDNLFKRVPGVEELKAVAAQKARAYVEALSPAQQAATTAPIQSDTP